MIRYYENAFHDEYLVIDHKQLKELKEKRCVKQFLNEDGSIDVVEVPKQDAFRDIFSAVFSFAVTSAAAAAVGSLFRPPELVSSPQDQDISQQYNWQGTAFNDERSGIALPCVIGTHLGAPPKITEFTEPNASRALIALFFVSNGEVDIDQVYVDGIEEEAFASRNVISDVRGDSAGGSLRIDDYTIPITGDQVASRVTINFITGAGPHGGFVPYDAANGFRLIINGSDVTNYTIQFRTTGTLLTYEDINNIESVRIVTAQYQNFRNFTEVIVDLVQVQSDRGTVDGMAFSQIQPFRSNIEVNLPNEFPTETVVRTRRQDADGFAIGVNFSSGIRNQGGDMTYNVTYTVEYRRVGDTSYTAMTGAPFTVTGVEPAQYDHQMDFPARGHYDIRFRFTQDPQPDNSSFAPVTISYVQEYIRENFAFPGIAKILLQAGSSRLLSQRLPVISCIATRSTVDVHNGTAIVQMPSNLCAWAAYYVINDNETGLGAPHANIDYDSFNRWGTFCMTNGLNFNAYFDSGQPVAERLKQIETVGRANIIQRGNMYFATYEEATTTPRLIVNTESIAPGSMRLVSTDRDSLPNVVSMSYYDNTDLYRRKQVEVTTSGFDATEEQRRTTRINAVGIVTETQALAAARRVVRKIVGERFTASYRMNIRASGVNINDVHLLSSDIFSADIRSVVDANSTQTTIRLKEPVYLESGITYQFRATPNNSTDASEDVVESSNFTVSDSGFFAQIVLTTALTEVLPEYSEISIRNVSVSDVLVRVKRVSRVQGETSIESVEYNPSIDTLTGVTVTDPTFASLPNAVTGISLRSERQNDGDVILIISWDGGAGMWRVNMGSMIVSRSRFSSLQYTLSSPVEGQSVTLNITNELTDATGSVTYNHTSTPSRSTSLLSHTMGNTIEFYYDRTGNHFQLQSATLQEQVSGEWVDIASVSSGRLTVFSDPNSNNTRTFRVMETDASSGVHPSADFRRDDITFSDSLVTFDDVQAPERTEVTFMRQDITLADDHVTFRDILLPSTSEIVDHFVTFMRDDITFRSTDVTFSDRTSPLEMDIESNTVSINEQTLPSQREGIVQVRSGTARVSLPGITVSSVNVLSIMPLFVEGLGSYSDGVLTITSDFDALFYYKTS